MDSKESNIVLEALKCLRYDTERVERLVLKTKSATTNDHNEVIDKLKTIDELIKKWSNN
mgnify:CR=1 FL=1|jgi:hypothetical protein